MTDTSAKPAAPAALRTRSWPWIAVVALTGVGLSLSGYLVLEHYEACHNPGQAVCDINEVISCSKVSLSDYSVFAGMPVAVWGVLGYLMMAAVGFWGWFGRGPRAAAAALMALTGFSALTSLTLGIISKTLIGAICLFCLGTYAVNALLLVPAIALFVSAGPGRSFGAAIELLGNHWQRTVSWALVGAVLLGLLMWKYPKYWLEASAHAAPQLPKVELPPAPSASGRAESNAKFTTGVTKDGHHWIGAGKPQVVVEEFSDYQCPFCRVAHARLRELIQKHPGKIRLVHRHFPLDQRCNPIITQSFHDNACYYSALVTCAGEQHEFWRANDYVFERAHNPEPIDKEVMAKDLGIDGKQLHECLEKRAWNQMRPDVEQGIELELEGTPSFVINGEKQTGADPIALLEPYLK
jgi:protein-disulfide isomerase/uncharacterized membrane protein